MTHAMPEGVKGDLPIPILYVLSTFPEENKTKKKSVGREEKKTKKRADKNLNQPACCYCHGHILVFW